MCPDLGALDTIAHHFKLELPDERRLLILGHHERVSTSPEVSHITYEGERLPSPRHDGDILINLPKDDIVDEAGLTLSVISSLAERRARQVKQTSLRAVAATAFCGLGVSFVGDVVAHNFWTTQVGYGIFAASVSAAAWISQRNPKAPSNAEGFNPPILLGIHE